MKPLLPTALLAVLPLWAPLEARECVVAPIGQDAHPGTAEKPFATVLRAVRAMQPGDVCLLRGGRYEEILRLRQQSGTPDKPIIFQAWPGEKVILDGSSNLAAEWIPWKCGIFRAKVTEPVRQLFLNDRMLIPARWPNADIHDDSAWDLHGTWRHVGPGSSFGHIIDADPVLKEDAKPWLEDSRLARNTQSLASTGKSFTGATIVMNIGSWLTWAQTISKHEAGSNEIRFDLDFSKSGPTMKHSAAVFPGRESFWDTKITRAKEGYYHITGSLDCLDAPGEWFHDRESGWLYVKPWKPTEPDWSSARIRPENDGLTVTQSEHIIFRDLEFFASLARFPNCRNILLENCRFTYPSAGGIPVGEFKRPEVVSFRGPGDGPSGNIVRNCVFEFCDGPGIEMSGSNDLIENCLFHAVDWTCLGTGGEGSLNLSSADGLTFRHNTLDLAGNSEGIRVGPNSLVEYNLVSRTGLLQHDGSAINVGVSCIKGTTLRRNWVHDTPKAALRFDSANMGSPDVRYGTGGTMIENVVWDTLQIKVKGEDHRILANTAFDNERIDLAVLDDALSGGINKKTVTIANLAGSIAGSFRTGSKRKPTRPLPGDARDNWTGAVRDQLRDPDHLDFRPKPGATIINATAPIDLMPGDSPRKRDIGAYQSSVDEYWIPGRREVAASNPVPQSGATMVPATAELMWRKALDATEYAVYWGDDPNEVATADESSPTHYGRTGTCRFTPPEHAAGKPCFWRIDTLTPSGTVMSEVWSYRVAP